MTVQQQQRRRRTSPGRWCPTAITVVLGTVILLLQHDHPQLFGYRTSASCDASNCHSPTGLFAHAFRRRSRAPAKPEVEEKDLYGILGVERDADEGAIRKAYRKLSRKYHPDKNQGDEEAAKKFQAISEANEILSDEEKKFLYDRGGMAAVAEADQPQGHNPFAAFFGGQQQQSGAPRTAALNYEVGIDLETIYSGETMQTTIQVVAHCQGCKKGTPDRNSDRCKACRARCPNEMKMVQRQMGPGFLVNQQMEVPSEEKCKQESRTLDLLIEKGAHTGEELTFKGQGNRDPDKLPGDVIIAIKEKPHDFFTRSGDDLLVTWKISLKEALVGGAWSFPALDGHEIQFSTDAVTKPGDTWRIKGEGMPVHQFPSESGDLLITFEVDFPRGTLNQEQSDLIRAALLPTSSQSQHGEL